MKRTISAVIAASALGFATPVIAQDAQDTASDEMQAEVDAMGELFGDIFGTAEPLTPEQEARVPVAQSVVLKLFPEGTYTKMMSEGIGPMMDGIMGRIAGSPAIMLFELTGITPGQLSSVDEANLSEAVALLDPNMGERNAEMTDLMMSMISDVMVKMEPSYRAGLARAYAVRFTEEELADLDAYFATEVGKKYAAESFLIFSDPQVMSAMNEMMPAMMETMPTMMGSVGEMASKYPKGRTFSDLNPEEQDRLAALLGTTLEDLAANEPERESEAGDTSYSEEEAEAEWVSEEGAS